MKRFSNRKKKLMSLLVGTAAFVGSHPLIAMKEDVESTGLGVGVKQDSQSISEIKEVQDPWDIIAQQGNFSEGQVTDYRNLLESYGARVQVPFDPNKVENIVVGCNPVTHYHHYLRPSEFTIISPSQPIFSLSSKKPLTREEAFIERYEDQGQQLCGLWDPEKTIYIELGMDGLDKFSHIQGNFEKILSLPFLPNINTIAIEYYFHRQEQNINKLLSNAFIILPEGGKVLIESNNENFDQKKLLDLGKNIGFVRSGGLEIPRTQESEQNKSIWSMTLKKPTSSGRSFVKRKLTSFEWGWRLKFFKRSLIKITGSLF